MNTNGPNLPAEVWSRIFELSCTDNGYTGQSMSLVSRSFCRCSAPYKLQSISLQGIKFICRFLAFLHTLPPSQRRVKYLCIMDPGSAIWTYATLSNWDTINELPFDTFCIQSEDGSSEYCNSELEEDTHRSDCTSSSCQSEEEAYEYAPTTDTEIDEISEEMTSLALENEDLEIPAGYAAPLSLLPESPGPTENYLHSLSLAVVQAILELCPNTLVHLSVKLRENMTFRESFDCRGTLLPQVHMPHLQELTWMIPLALHARAPMYPPRQPQPVLFPSLERLHLGDVITKVTGPIVQDACPKLLYLRGHASYTYIKWASVRNEEMPFHTPDTVIQHLMDCSIDTGLPSILQSIQDAPDKLLSDNRVKFVIQRKSDMQTIQDDWQDRILGGTGGWKWIGCTADPVILREAARTADRTFEHWCPPGLLSIASA
ncbi:hypothetical protein BDN72DRAFT_618337 [Pluteus cervinus]|uniref:Uncharacterized protein n=1 Tax=Pluteus cervinus TaxID=181527 RepID=A0ACD3AU73_9AGAR|nr:hypothetical protein BDN72DRAFT_618337 [Pluteus cervinus]